MYHVLGGLISPLDGINPDQINIDSLLKRIKKGDIKEVIFALKPSIEGETTTLYIRKLLENTDVIISKIAHGIPMGADIDYIDSLTLELALEDRKTINIKE
jgi:recombination protein RecR